MSQQTYLSLWLLAMLVAPLVSVLFIRRLIANDKTSRFRRVFDVDPSAAQVHSEITSSFLTSPVHVMLTFLFIEIGLFAESNVVLLIPTFLGVFLWVEVWHYASHRAMHHKRFHRMHRHHHRSRAVNIFSSFSFSISEKAVFTIGILLPVYAVDTWVPLSAEGFFLYYLFYFYTNTLGHSNYEFRKPGYLQTWMGRCVNSPTYHALHHARYIGHYGLMTPFLDRWLNTQWEDYPAIFERVAAGQPLEQLKDRIGAGSSPARLASDS